MSEDESCVEPVGSDGELICDQLMSDQIGLQTGCEVNNRTVCD